VVFPVEVLIPIFVAEACVSLSIYFLLLFGLVLVMEGTPHFSFFLIFLLFFLFVFFLCGVGWFLALLGAFFRDTSHLMSFGIVVFDVSVSNILPLGYIAK
jgi:lipopolysaccharide transport system permease protein